MIKHKRNQRRKTPFPAALIFRMAGSISVVSFTSSAGSKPEVTDQILHGPRLDAFNNRGNRSVLTDNVYENCFCTALLHAPEDTSDVDEESEQEH